MADIECACDLSDDIPDERGGEKLSHFILNRGDGLCPEFLTPCCKFILPEALHERVRDMGDDFLPEAVIGVHPHDAKHRVATGFNEGEEGVPQNVFHTPAPDIRPEL